MIPQPNQTWIHVTTRKKVVIVGVYDLPCTRAKVVVFRPLTGKRRSQMALLTAEFLRDYTSQASGAS